jgi:hypothetical protein
MAELERTWAIASAHAAGVWPSRRSRFPAHGRSIRQYRQALYEFEKER